VRVLVIGSGAREHALLLALAADPAVTALAAAPGNAGTAAVAEHPGLADPSSGTAVVDLARRWRADLVVIGPEAPLVAGVGDALRDAGIPCFGPSSAAARIEGSKAFAKDVMTAAHVPTARSEVVDGPAGLDAALARFEPPWVVKDDGLAAGKGVLVTVEYDDARAHAMTVLEAGHPVLLESYLDGPEVSLFCCVDGTDVVPLVPAQDSKRLGDGDVGPNTGGMGAYAPLPWAPEGLVEDVVDTIVRPVATEMARRGTPFSGLLYAGLALTSSGPQVVEFNCRFGDPETQAVLALLRSSLASLLLATTRRRDDGAVVSSGGRVLSVVGTGASLEEARADAYRRIEGVKLPGAHWRTDIGLAAVEGRIAGV
jgi:phosphoribosylamine---glycine ligase